MRVVYQGEPGAFSEEAVLAFFGDGAEAPDRTAVPTWRAVFDAVADGSADRGVIAIESSLAGSIRETYDLLAEFFDRGVRIVGEVSVPVRLALLALPGQSLDGIERVYSHAQALAQADEFLRSRDWQVLTTYNTAGAARMIAETGSKQEGAIASVAAASRFGLAVLAERIQTEKENFTKFAVIATEGSSLGEADKTSLVMAVADRPGSLLASLQPFAERGINLHKLESRPRRGRAFEYVMYVDLMRAAEHPDVVDALAEVAEHTSMLRVLGSYRAAPEPT